MKLTQKFLSINEFSRPGKQLNQLLGIILHWTGPNGHTAKQVWDYFENDCPKTKKYSSAQYIIDFTGEILQCIPNNEIAYHCGSSKNDPISKVIYTDWAREKFGIYANDKKYTDRELNKIKTSPNQVTIGIEMCAVDETGAFRDNTIYSAIELVTSLCLQYNIDTSFIGTHNKVVGWKDCPRLWTFKNYLFEAFINDVKRSVDGSNYKNININERIK